MPVDERYRRQEALIADILGHMPDKQRRRHEGEIHGSYGLRRMEAHEIGNARMRCGIACLANDAVSQSVG